MRKEFVIKKYLEYQEIIKKRKFKKSSSFTIYYQLSDNPYPRIGLLVGKKNGIAVIRNKIKRQVRTFVDKYIDKDLNLNLIIAMTRNYDITKFEENEKEFEKQNSPKYKDKNDWRKKNQSKINEKLIKEILKCVKILDTQMNISCVQKEH